MEQNTSSGHGHSNPQQGDEKLTVRLSEALDRSLDDIDELTLQRIKHARINALKHTSKPARKWVSLSVAASFAALLLIPFMVHQHALTLSNDQQLDVVAQEVPLSAEELDDIDMLMALEDSDA